MFGKATHWLIHQIDEDGVLIAVSRLNDSKKLKPLGVVIKRPAVWFWQKTKYSPTAFTLNDLLEGESIQPELERTEFLKYKAKHEGVYGGSVEAGIVGINLKAKGLGTSKLSSCLGTLRQENVNLQKLLQDSESRKVNLEHQLLKQTRGKTQQAYALVIERVFTTCDCTIEYNGVKEGNCITILKALGICPTEVCLKETSTLQYDTDVAIEIPPNTVLAYSVINLDIKNDGHYELSACCDGFESDDDSTKSSLYNEDQVDGLLALPEIPEGSSLSVLKKVLSDVKTTLLELAHLPAQSRLSLLPMFRKIILKKTLLSTLEEKLAETLFMLRVGEASCLSRDDESNELIDSFLQHLEPQRSSTAGLSTMNQKGSLSGLHTPANKNKANYNGTSSAASYMNGASNENGSQLAQSSQNGASTKSSKHSQSVLTAMYMLVSAAEGLTDSGLILLETLCSSDVLNGLNDLVNLLTEDSQPLLIDSLPSPLQNEHVFLKVQALFSVSKIMLKRDKKIWAETQCSSEYLPLTLCVVIYGLAYLNEAQT
ncbi:hypothetical protein NFI96_016879 [Prochilodus magdalenae]|nr:hypothetical protein NFI96_016879 [Prochilodus magdalenae]